jgi:hypothetical protein
MMQDTTHRKENAMVLALKILYKLGFISADELGEIVYNYL